MERRKIHPGDDDDGAFEPWEKLEESTTGFDDRAPEDVSDSSERDRRFPGRKDIREVPQEPLAQRLRKSRKE